MVRNHGEGAEFSEETVSRVRSELLVRLLSEEESEIRRVKRRKRSVELFGLKSQEDELYDRLKRAVELGESTSMICIGQRGCGKRSTVRRALERLEAEDRHYDVIALDGVLHNEAAGGIREAVRQLSAEGQQRNIASRYVEDLNILVDEVRRRRAEQSAPLLVVLSQLELFATQQERQTLLYTLLDAIQLPDSCLVVLGLATDASVLQKFEKRVRSRLHNHQIYFYHPAEQDIIAALDNRISGLEYSDTVYYQTFCKAWEETIKSSPEFIFGLKRAVALGRPFRYHTRVAAHAIASLSSKQPVLTPHIWQTAIRAQQPTASEHWIDAIAALPPPQLALFLAYLRYERDHRQSYTLNDASNELNKLARRNTAVTQFPAPILLRAHAHLLTSTIIILVDTSRAASSALEPSTLRYAKVRLSGAICLEDIWTALRKDLLRTPTALRQWTVQPLDAASH